MNRVSETAPLIREGASRRRGKIKKRKSRKVLESVNFGVGGVSQPCGSGQNRGGEKKKLGGGRKRTEGNRELSRQTPVTKKEIKKLQLNKVHV